MNIWKHSVMKNFDERIVLVNLDLIDEYLEAFRDEEF